MLNQRNGCGHMILLYFGLRLKELTVENLKKLIRLLKE